MLTRFKIRLGDLLVEHRIVTAEQLESALVDQKKSGRKLGRILIENQYLGEDKLLEFLSRQLDIPFIDLSKFPLDPAVAALLPEIHARRFRAVALKVETDGVLIAMSDPTNVFAYDELTRILGKAVRLAVVREAELLKAIDVVYRHAPRAAGPDRSPEIASAGGESGVHPRAAAGAAEAPAAKLLQILLEDAFEAKATDMHIEMDRGALRVRQRVGGVLCERPVEDGTPAAALLSEVKRVAGFEFPEQRLLRDGRFSARVPAGAGTPIEVRVSILPVQGGESAVLRLSGPDEGLGSLDQLGMPADLLARFESLLRRPDGVLAIAGPGRSGRTTTLYAALQRLNGPAMRVISVEDPVESLLPRVSQVQIDAATGLRFDRALHAALRQDPDVVSVGDMNDRDTAELALRAATGGRLVLAAVAGADAIGALRRLLQQCTPPDLLAAAWRGVLAQVLLPRICQACAKPAAPERRELERLRELRHSGAGMAETAMFMRGSGCGVCHQSGSSGRVAAFELLEPDVAMAQALRDGDPAGLIAQARRAPGYRPLYHAALDLAASGQTPLAAALRVAADTGAWPGAAADGA